MDTAKIQAVIDALPAAVRPLSVGLDHIGLAVVDLQASLALYRDLMGLPLLYQETVESDGVRVAVLELGGGHLELLEPTGPESPVARFLDKRGPGIHHVALRVKDCARALQAARDAGLRVIDETPRGGAGGKQIAFLHPKSTGGVLLELCQPDEATLARPQAQRILGPPIELDPYEPWPPRKLDDPRVALIPTVTRNLVPIIRSEGPMVAHLAYRRYAVACGVNRVRASLQRRFDQALEAAILREELVVLNEEDTGDPSEYVVRTPEAPDQRVRQIGDRKFADVPLVELAALMKRLRDEAGIRDAEELFRSVCACYGLSRMRASTRATMEQVAAKHGLLD